MPTLNNLAERAGTGDEEVPPGDFAVDTAVWPDPTVTGRYHANLSEAWKVFYAFGGCSMAVALRAAQHAVGRPDLTPRLASAVFAAPVKCGPLVVDTEVLRVGRAVAQATAKLRSAGAATGSDVHLTAVFGREQDSSPNFVDTEWPADALSVADSIVPMPPAFNYAQQVECRIGMPGFDFANGDTWRPGPARALTWYRLVKEPRLADGTIDPLSYCAPADILAPAMFAKLGPTGPNDPPCLILSLEITVQFLATTTSPWILQHTRIPHAGGGYAYAFVELWDEAHQLIAVATQRGHLRSVSMACVAQPDGHA